MSLFGSINSATSGLRTVQANLNVVSDNIARINDPTRTRHILAQTTDNLGLVVTSDFRRETADGLKAQLYELDARAGRSGTQDDYLSKIGDLLRTSNGQPLITQYVDNFITAWKTLETSPDSETAQYQAIQAANSFARELNRVSNGVESIDNDLNNDIVDTVDKVNDLLKQIDDINDNIVSLKSQGSAANEAADKRDDLVRQINQLVGVKSFERSDGRVALYSDSGLALLDSDLVKLAYSGGKIYQEVGSTQVDITDHLKQGKLGAIYEMRYDGSTLDPPEPAKSTPATAELIRKLRSQLDALASAFTATTADGEPTSFADAYDSGDPTATDELSGHFFVGTDRFTFALNSKLLDNTLKIKQSSIEGVADALSAAGRSISADGLEQTDLTYSNMAAAITGKVMSIASTVSSLATTDKDAQSTLEERFRGATGVNLDEELALLQQLQTSYAAAARVMQVTNKMFDTLESVVT